MASLARAAEPSGVAPAPATATSPTAEQIEAAVKADAEPKTPLTAEAPHVDDAPLQPLPRRKGLVLEGSLGALAFFGQFRRVAPTAPWLHMQVGYEVLHWLMVFAEGELAFSDTSVSQDSSKSRAFPIFGFGAGPRFTLHPTERVAVYGQVSLGALKADVPSGAFAVLGFGKAESLGLSYGARLGVEWYQLDRHLALGVGIGVRNATGFTKTFAGKDRPLMGDASASLRYTF